MTFGPRDLNLYFLIHQIRSSCIFFSQKKKREEKEEKKKKRESTLADDVELLHRLPLADCISQMTSFRISSSETLLNDQEDE